LCGNFVKPSIDETSVLDKTKGGIWVMR